MNGAPAQPPKRARNACGKMRTTRCRKHGDSVTLSKDLTVKGSSSIVKVGAKVTNILLVAGDHDIDCKIDGFGAMGLKTAFVKKA
jgi:protein PhnA